MRDFLLFISLCFLLVSCAGGEKAHEAASQATSEIPDKREFPVNPAIDPCKNFHDYACSRVEASFKLREDRSRHIFSFSDSDERLLEAKKKFLAGLSTDKNLSERGQELRDTYLGCMNEGAAQTEEKKYVGELGAKIRELSDREALKALMAKRILSEDQGLVSFGIIGNQDKPSLYDVYFLSSLRSLPERSYYENAEVVKDLTDVMVTFFKVLGEKDAEARAKGLVSFETEFSKSYPLPAEMREIISSRNYISREELVRKYPNLKLEALFLALPAKTPVRHLTPENYAFLNEALGAKPLEQWKDVLLFHSLTSYMDDAYPEFFKKWFAFQNKHLGGPAVRPDRKERCTRMIMSQFAMELDAELVPRLFPHFPEKRFRKLAEKIRTSILVGVQKNEWLSPSAKKAALRKIRTARLQLVKPTREVDWDFNLKADYSPAAPYSNRRLFARNEIKKELSKVRRPKNRDEWSMGPLTVNAYYSPQDNKFVMPIGILQPPFFDSALSDEANLGAVGMVIGHELGHAIDDKGARYDEHGKLSQWMSESDLAEFKKRGDVLVTQFKQIGHNGVLTLGENIGDFVGLTFAYHAAFPKTMATPEGEKAFFLQYARLWCGVARPKHEELLLKTDPHSLGRARINEQVKHQPAFETAFSCKAGDPMIRAASERVRIW